MTDVYLEAATDYDDYSSSSPVYSYGLFNANLTLPSGWIGLQVGGYRNGGLCGWQEQYNNQSDSWWVQQWNLCSNPSGTQTFYSDAAGLVWNGDNAYASWGWQNSPSLTH